MSPAVVSLFVVPATGGLPSTTKQKMFAETERERESGAEPEHLEE